MSYRNPNYQEAGIITIRGAIAEHQAPRLATLPGLKDQQAVDKGKNGKKKPR